MGQPNRSCDGFVHATSRFRVRDGSWHARTNGTAFTRIYNEDRVNSVGRLVVSLDFQLSWGTRDNRSIADSLREPARGHWALAKK